MFRTAPQNSSLSTKASVPKRAYPLRRLLWKAAIPMTAFLLIMIASDTTARLRDPSPRLSLGHDFLPSYSAGLLVRQGNPRGMYDRDALSTVEFQVIHDANLEISGRYGPWLNPPFYAWVFAPLSMLSYREAATIFLVFNIAIFVVTLVLLTRMLFAGGADAVGSALRTASWRMRKSVRSADPTQTNFIAGTSTPGQAVPVDVDFRETKSPRRPGMEATCRDDVPLLPTTSTQKTSLDWRTAALVPLLTILPLPVWQAMGHQQNTFISLFLLTASVICWRQNRAFLAGIVTGLLFFKPQLAAVFALVLVIGMGWRAFAGLTVTGIVLLAVTLLTMPGCLYDFLHRLPPILHWQQVESPYNWGRQVTFHSFWRLLIQGQVRAETVIWAKLLWWLSTGAAAGAMLTAIWRFRMGIQSPIARDRLIAATIVSMPMLMPYYMDYDLLLLALPAVLLAKEWIRQPGGITRADHFLLATWILFAVESHFNPGISGSSHFNPVVPLLGALSVLHIWRCVRSDVSSVAIDRKTEMPLSRAA